MAKPTKKPTNRKRAHSRGIDPASGLGKKLAGRTEDNLTPAMKMFRDRFISEYLYDYSAVNAYRRAGGTAGGRQAYNIAYELTHEPYVAKKIQEAIDSAEEKELVNRNRVLAGLAREANREGMGAQHGARVSAWATLVKVFGMDRQIVEASLALRGGILIVPATDNVETWDERSRKAQKMLKESVRS